MRTNKAKYGGTQQRSITFHARIAQTTCNLTAYSAGLAIMQSFLSPVYHTIGLHMYTHTAYCTAPEMKDVIMQPREVK